MGIIIVGAGIAGLGAGVALRRAGHKVTILQQSSLLHEVGVAITIKPNSVRVLASWDFVPEQSSMVALRGMSLVDGTNMKTLVPTYYKDCESTWGLPMYAVHRDDLHAQLKTACWLERKFEVRDSLVTNGRTHVAGTQNYPS